jgi:HK97 gp10 family phage protein
MPLISIDVDSRQVQMMLKVAPDKVNDRLKRVLNVVAIETQREMRIAAPVAVTGDLRQSVKWDVTGLTATIGPTAKHAEFVEKGTRPHWTSARPGSSLYKWASLKGISPYAVQRSIALKGTKAHPFVEPTHTLMEPRIIRRFDSEIEKLTSELSDG